MLVLNVDRFYWLAERPNDDPSHDVVDLEENESLAWASADHIASNWHKIKSRFGSGPHILGRLAGVNAWQICL